MKRKWGHGSLTKVPFIFFIIPLQNEVVSELSGLPIEHRLGPRFPAEAMIAGTASIMRFICVLHRTHSLGYVDHAVVYVLVYFEVQTLLPQSVDIRKT